MDLVTILPTHFIPYMGGPSQDVTWLKMWDCYVTLYTLGFHDQLIFLKAIMKITMYSKHLEAIHIMSCDRSYRFETRSKALLVYKI